MEFLTFFDEGEPNVNLYGGKGSNLIKLKRLGINVPNGFIINSHTFKIFLKTSKNSQKINNLFSHKIEVSELLNISNEIQTLIRKSAFPNNFIKEIQNALVKLEISNNEGFFKAVRSSANFEDSKSFSFAGQAESFLCNESLDDITNSIKECWCSLFSPGALLYLIRINREGESLDLKDLQMAVIIQKMIESEISGVTFTSNILNNNRDEILINSAWGLGEAIASNKTTPDTFIVNKKDLQILRKIIGKKDKMVINHPDEPCTKVTEVDKDLQTIPSLNDTQIKEICRISLEIESLLGSPQDIEWAFHNNEIYILQSRPITTLK
ncbi:MAG: hypothetical protein EU521_01030 [Promethearchaeota archaeon]|nr:MAG: hypothetical protein EU521_01030 [Candidatus Lokiarchaeota archaeon]